MHPNVSIAALACVAVSLAGALALVCATNQTAIAQRLNQHQQQQQQPQRVRMATGGKIGAQMNKTQSVSSFRRSRASASNSAVGRQIGGDKLAPIGALPKFKILNETLVANSSSYGSQAEASILRPLILRHLLAGGVGGQRALGKAPAVEEEEEEEVTKTIMVPMNANEADIMEAARGTEEADGPTVMGQSNHMIHYVSGKQAKLHGAGAGPAPPQPASGAARGNQLSHMMANAADLSGAQPNAEASLRLTSTEIGGLLNDREAPEFYRERELAGDGVVVGEERPPAAGQQSSMSATGRLGTAASGPFGSQFMGGEGMPYGAGMGGFDSGEALYRARLNQAASEEAYGGGGGGGGFNHRFGQQAFGAGESELGSGGPFGGAGAGGLMQAPNEYNQVSSLGAGYMGAGGEHAYGNDYSLQSGLLRAGSEGLYGGGGGAAFGASHMMGGGSGFMGASGSLDTAAAHAGAFGGGGGGEFAGQNSFYGAGAGGRLQAHASYNPYMQAAGGEADYANRFGNHPGANYGGPFGEMGGAIEQRGFASQQNHQFMRSAGGETSQATPGAGAGGRSSLLPLTPTIPLADDLTGGLSVTQPSVLASNQREQVSQQQQQQQQQQQLLQQSQQPSGRFEPRTRSSQQPQLVHEALEEDPTDVSADDSTGDERGYESGSGSEGDEAAASGRPSGANMARVNHGGELGTSLVLNVPPPSADQAASQHQLQQMVEFSRVGSAGYLGPRSSSLAKKFGPQRQQSQVVDAGEDEDGSGGGSGDGVDGAESSHGTAGEREPADNPAHAGKYIIN